MKFVNMVFITNLPSFYKINLYNRIAERKKIVVIYTGDGKNQRNLDFFSGEAKFSSLSLNGNVAFRNIQIVKILCFYRYDELVIGGWDSLPMWVSAFLSPKEKNSVVIESSYYESKITGLKGFMKKIFLSRISKVYASGISQKKISDALGFKGSTVITKGVGVFNYIKQPAFVRRQKVENFLYVGRFAACKNLKFLIRAFNELPKLKLFMVGFGPQEEELRLMSKQNVIFLGEIKNKLLSDVYQKMDVFVLPSISEPWGLVVEEALNNGLPVLVSDRVGCAEEIININKNGLIFSHDDICDFKEKVSRICNLNLYNDMRMQISKMDFEEIENRQVECYI